MPRRQRTPKQVETIVHDEAKRTNIPTAEYSSAMEDNDRSPIEVAYARRNRDLDPQLVWRGKDEQDASDLVVQAPPLYIQEKVHPKVLIDDLMRRSSRTEAEGAASIDGFQPDLFSDFNGLPEGADRTDFYAHDANWSNRMILGDSLQVMASLAEREGLRGKVQCIYIDPPYGIRFNSNFQWSTTSRDVKDGNAAHITREPEQVKAFRDTWRDGIHTYISYLRERLLVARDLLSDSGSLFVQIGEENVHLVRAVLDEIFGRANYVNMIPFMKTAGLHSDFLPNVNDYILWFAKDRPQAKFRRPYAVKQIGGEGTSQYTWAEFSDGGLRPLSSNEIVSAGLGQGTGGRLLSHQSAYTAGAATTTLFDFTFQGRTFKLPSGQRWRTPPVGMRRLVSANRLFIIGNSLRYKRFFTDFLAVPIQDVWRDTSVSGFSEARVYVVQTNPKVISRCVNMVTDPGDLVVDPTCGGGTTAYVAEQWGRRWITVDTSRVALALARARIMGARYPYYLLSDSAGGREKEAEVARTEPSSRPTYGDIGQGFVCERVPHIQLRDITNNTEIDVIWELYQELLEPLREQLNAALGDSWRSGISHARPMTGGRPRRGRCTSSGGSSASIASARSTPRSPRRRTSSTCTTSPTPTTARCASPGRSRSRASRPTASSALTRTTSSSTGWPNRPALTVSRGTSARWSLRTFGPPVCSRRTRRIASCSPRSRRGRARWFAPRGATSKAAPATMAPGRRSEPASSSGRSSARCRGRISWRPPARPPTRASTR